MGFIYTPRAFYKPFENHPGELVIHLRHSGAYTRDQHLDLLSIFSSNINFKSAGLKFEQLTLPQPQMLNNGLYFGMTPIWERAAAAVTGCAVDAGTGLARVTSAAHKVQTGEYVIIRNVQGSTEVNGRFIANRVADNTFDVRTVTSVTSYSSSTDSGIWVARPFPTITISGITTAGVMTASAAHNLKVGDVVYMTTVGGLTGASRGYLDRPLVVKTVPSTTTLTIEGLTWSGGAFSGTTYMMVQRTTRHFGIPKLLHRKAMALVSATAASPSVFTTAPAHGLRVGDDVMVSGVLDATLGAAVNKYARVRTVPSATTFTLEDQAGAIINGASSNTANTGFVEVFAEPIATQVIDCEGLVRIPLIVDKSDGPWYGPLNV